MSDLLKNRNAIITGANQGLGLAIAHAYLAAGANLVLCARDGIKLKAAAEALQQQAAPGQKVIWDVCDVAVPLEVTTLVDTALRELGSVDILVNNAGMQRPIGAFEDVDWNEWVRTIEINLLGPAFFCRSLIPHFKKNGHGKIINLSGGGATAPLPRISAYAASKAAVVRLTETLAHELKDYHIDINAIAPGALNTRMLNDVLEAGRENAGGQYDRALKQQESGGASLENAAALCVFLASEKSDGITGRLISAQWDPWKTLDTRRDELAAGDLYTLRRIVPEDRGKKWD